MKTYSIIFLLALASFSYNFIGGNTVKGKIDLSNINESLIRKGTSYKDNAAAISAEKKKVEEINQPKNNIYISLHPLDFEPELSPTKDVKMTQRAKTFCPNVVAVTKGSTVHFVNEDEHYHNVYSLTKKARFNIGRRPTGNVYGQKINKVGVVKLGCDIHPEMGGVILSLDTPYFTKINEDGTYKITNLPDGSYKIQVYHPLFQKYTEEISVKGNEVMTKDIKLEAKA